MNNPGIQSIFAAQLLVKLLLPAFLLRRRQKRDKRWDAFDEIFSGVHQFLEESSRLKPRWTEQWNTRSLAELPPKYSAELFDYPGATDAIYNLRFAVRLLQQNRWKSKVRPLFAQVDERQWSIVRGTISHFAGSLVVIQDSYRNTLRADEIEWIEQTVEEFDQVRYRLNQDERDDTPTSQVVAQTTYAATYCVMNLSERIISRLRYDASGELEAPER